MYNLIALSQKQRITRMTRMMSTLANIHSAFTLGRQTAKESQALSARTDTWSQRPLILRPSVPKEAGPAQPTFKSCPRRNCLDGMVAQVRETVRSSDQSDLTLVDLAQPSGSLYLL